MLKANFLFSTLCVSSALVAGTIEDAAKQSKQITQHINKQQEHQFEKDRSIKGKTSSSHEVELLKTNTKVSSVCHNIETININGITVLNQEVVNKISKPYKNTCMGIQEISSLLGSLTNEYIKNGFITSRVYLPQQNLSSGTLLLNSKEGVIAQLKEDKYKNTFSFMTSFPTKKGEVLNLRDIEQGLDQLNRLASNNATMKIIPGKEVGQSNVVIENETSKPWLLSASLDNHGSKSTGKVQRGVSFGLDNPLNLNDYLSITYKTALQKDDTNQWQDNESTSFSYILPWGYNTFSFGKSDSTYQSTLATNSGNELKLNGTSDSYYAQAERLLYRDKTDKVSFSIKGTVKESKTYIADQFLEVSSRQLSIADFNMKWIHQITNGNVTFNMGVSSGTSWFDSLKDPDNLPEYFPKAQFSKVNLSLNSNKYFLLADNTTLWTMSFTGQKTSDVLYGSEQINIGGLYTVRGFEANSLSGDEGFYVRNDFVMTLPNKLYNGTVQPYIAIDTGYVRGNSENPINGSITGSALGVKYNRKSLSTDLVYTRPLRKHSSFEKESGHVYFRFAYSF